MQLGRPLPRSFFDRPCLVVARDLLGSLLVRRMPDGSRLAGRLVEVEAYLGDGTDPGSHSHRGPTKRNASMFGPPGRIYAYRIYGIHTCINVVCEKQGVGAAVLLRAVEPMLGISAMRQQRGLRKDQSDLWIARGPGRLAQALGLGLEADGETALRGPVTFHSPREGSSGRSSELICQSPRIGVNRGSELRYRFFLDNNAWVSPRKMH